MNPFLLRQFWALVETTQSNVLLGLDDASLIQWLLGQLQQERLLNTQETSVLNNYASSKLSLIRDLAQDRQMLCQGAL